jgi:hypothetical protein
MRRVTLTLLVLAAGCAETDVLNEAFGPSGRTLRETIATFPADQQDAFALLERKCSRCHSVNVPLAARFSRGAWSGQVRKMVRKPGSAIQPEEGDRIAAFLEYLEDQRRK